MSVVGIDLGTTNTVVACVRNGRVHVLADEDGRRLLPSVVSFHPNGNVLVGQAAKERRVVDARNTIASVKRLIGRSWQSEEIGKARGRFAFEMKEGPGHAPLVVARGQEYTLPEISAYVLKRAKQIGEAALGEPVERAVITVPASFNELQRASTKVAGRVAGLEVLRILNEPTAAALAYGFGKGGHERIAIYDFGGGTFDCTLLDLSGNVFEVLATAGDSFLGGDDLDTAIADRMAEAFLLQHRFDPKEDVQTFERLRAAAEHLKMELSTKTQAEVHLREVAFGVGGANLDLRFGMSRAELDVLAEPLIERTLKVCQESLALAGLNTSSFDKVLLVGGSTRISLVRSRVEKFFGRQPLDRLNPDEVVGIGAAIQAAALTDLARRRSIPPPPVPPVRAKVSTLSGLHTQKDEDTKRAAGVPPKTPGVGVRAVLTKTTPLPNMPAPGPRGTARIVAPPGLTKPIPPPLPASAIVNAPLESSSLDESSDDEITRTSPAATGSLPSIADDYAKLADTKSAADVTEDSQVATLTVDRSELEIPPAPPSDLASTTPQRRSPLTPDGVPAFPSFPKSSNELVDTRPGFEVTTSPGTDPISAPALPPITAPMSIASAFNIPDLPSQAAAPTPPALAAPPRLPTPPAPPLNRTAPMMPVVPIPPSVPPVSLGAAPAPAPPPILVDVTPRALVVETAGGYCDTIIPRNAKIPCERTRAFSPSRDFQTSVRIRVAQGEEEGFGANTYLGELELSELRSAMRNEIVITVTFAVDANGTVQVSATDTATGREARARLQLIGIAPEEAIAHMTRRAAGTHVSGRVS